MAKGGLEIELEVQGLEEIQKKLEREAMLGNPLKRILGRAALKIERQAKIYSPVKTGRLRASLNA
jgi:hypothetical protein